MHHRTALAHAVTEEQAWRIERPGRADIVACAAFSPDGKRIGTVSLTEISCSLFSIRIPNGFFLHGASIDYMRMYTSRAKDIKQRPAVMVIFEPK